MIGISDLTLFFFELVGTDAAQGAFVIFGQLIALVDIVTNGATELFHAVSSPLRDFCKQSAHRPVKHRWYSAT